MGKVKYLIQRIGKMNYGNMFKTIDQVHEKCGKNKLWIFFDCIACGLKYQSGYIDYYQFQMYNMNRKERKTIVTRGVNNAICKKYNDPKSIYKFEDKCVFNEIFDKYMKRDWLKLTGDNLDEFKKFAKKHDEIIVKPVGLSCGKGVEKIKVSDWDIKELYQKLMDNTQILVEEVAVQHKVLSDLYPLSINTLRIVTLNKIVVTAYVRLGNSGNVVDNFNHGGMVAAIDVEDGIVKHKAIDKQTNEFEIHPYTNKKIIGTKIPMWEEAKQICIDACDEVPEVGYIAWDVCMGPEGPSLIEGNDFPGHDLYELPVHKDNYYGLLPRLEKAMKEGK